jgi:hypothetical protein
MLMEFQSSSEITSIICHLFANSFQKEAWKIKGTTEKVQNITKILK